jgi:hypothetical protein
VVFQWAREALRARVPIRRDRCLQCVVGWHSGGGRGIEAGVVAEGGHGLDELLHLAGDESVTAGVDAVDLIAGVAVSPVGDGDAV